MFAIRLVPSTRAGRVARIARNVVGGIYVFTSGVNTGLVLADPEIYSGFADAAGLEVVRRLWQQVVMTDPTAWLVALAVGELLIGVLLLLGGGYARIGWWGVILFHLALMAFGPGTWLWCIPVLALVVPLARTDRLRLAEEQRHGDTSGRVHQTPPPSESLVRPET